MKKVIIILVLLALGLGVYLVFGQNTSNSAASLVAQAKADLAQRLGVDEESIEVVEVESVTWSDTSLGCPEPGKFYAQVLTPGYKIILEAQGTQYEYHTSMKMVKFCGEVKAPALKIAYLKEPEEPDPNGNLDLFLREFPGEKEVLIARKVTEFKFSADVKAVALMQRKSRSSFELSLARADGKDRKPVWLSFYMTGLVWSPVELKYAFLTREEVGQRFGVVIGQLPEDSVEGPIYLPEGAELSRGELEWSPDGSILFLKAWKIDGKCDLWTISMEDKRPKLLLRDCNEAQLLRMTSPLD